MDKAKKILITGSEGFVGSALKKALGDRVVCCDTSIGLSILEFVNSQDMSNIDTVVNCAAVQLFTPGVDLYNYETFYHANVETLDILVKACIKNKVKKFIHLSTDMVYGIPGDRAIVENQELKPVGFYGKTKMLAEQLLLRAVGDIPIITIFRPRVIGGPGRAGLFLLLAKLAKYHLPIPLFGNGRNKYQMVHVDDFVGLITEAIEKDVQGTFNVGSLEVTSLREKIEVAAGNLGVKPLFLPLPEVLVIFASKLFYKLRLGPLHPEQYMTTGRNFVLSLDNTLKNFEWRPKYSDNQIISESFDALKQSL